jgi:hypothetical protein
MITILITSSFEISELPVNKFHHLEEFTVILNNVDCKSDIRYGSDVQIIIESNCSTSGCHGPNGPMRGDFTSYESLLKYIENDGIFEKRLLVSKDMPPAYSPGRTKLSQEELDIIRCWIKQGFPK